MADSIPPEGSASALLQISHYERDGAIILALSGELDIASSPTFIRELEAAAVPDTQRMIIDLGGLAFMDSTGLRALLEAGTRAAAGGYELLLKPGPRQVQRVFELSGTIARFNFEE